MKEKNLYVIELTGDECQKIVTDHVKTIMKEKGYVLNVHTQDGDFCDVEFVGVAASVESTGGTDG